MKFFMLLLFISSQIFIFPFNPEYVATMQAMQTDALHSYTNTELMQSTGGLAYIKIRSENVRFEAGRLGRSPTASTQISIPDGSTCIGTSTAFIRAEKMVSALETTGSSWITISNQIARGDNYFVTATDPLVAFQGASITSPKVCSFNGTSYIIGINAAKEIVLQSWSDTQPQPTTTLTIPKASVTSRLNLSQQGNHLTLGYINANGNAQVTSFLFNHATNGWNIRYSQELDVASEAPQVYSYSSNDTSLVTVRTTGDNLTAYRVFGDGSTLRAVLANSIQDYAFSATDPVAVVSYRSGGDLYYTRFDPISGLWDEPFLFMTNGTLPACSARQLNTFYIGGRDGSGLHRMYYKSGNNSLALAYTSNAATSSTQSIFWAVERISTGAINRKGFFTVSSDNASYTSGVSASYSPSTVIVDEVITRGLLK